MAKRIMVLSGATVLLGTTLVLMSVAGRAASPPSACPGYDPQLDPAHFVSAINNQYFPLPIGRVLTYRGVRDGQTQVDKVTVTNQKKVILGITATVVTDVATHNDQLLEETTDWYAQDDRGNVWYLGEDTKAYLPGGKVDTSGSWEAGVNGAKPGLIMEASPQVPDAYRQECLTGEALDTAWVVSLGGSVKVAYGNIHNVVRTLEFTQLEPDVVDEKYYGPGLGIVLERTMAGGDEFAELVSVQG